MRVPHLALLVAVLTIPSAAYSQDSGLVDGSGPTSVLRRCNLTLLWGPQGHTVAPLNWATALASQV